MSWAPGLRIGCLGVSSSSIKRARAGRTFVATAMGVTRISSHPPRVQKCFRPPLWQAPKLQNSPSSRHRAAAASFWQGYSKPRTHWRASHFGLRNTRLVSIRTTPCRRASFGTDARQPPLGRGRRRSACVAPRVASIIDAVKAQRLPVKLSHLDHLSHVEALPLVKSIESPVHQLPRLPPWLSDRMNETRRVKYGGGR